MQFVSYEQMTHDAITLARKLPRNVQGVLGIPRSGMLVASIVAQELDCHLGDALTFAATGMFQPAGRRINWLLRQKTSGPIVLIDDSVYAGATMEVALRSLWNRERLDPLNLCTAALYVLPGMADRVDFHVREVEPPRLFAWNWRSHDLMEKALWDMDGALCTDPTGYPAGSDGPEYEEALRRVEPLWIPKRKVLAVVTSRLERHRFQTQCTLDELGVRYGNLIMGPWETPELRRAYESDDFDGSGPTAWKADMYAAREDAQLFVESSRLTAGGIWEATNRPVFCPADGGFLYEGDVS